MKTNEKTEIKWRELILGLLCAIYLRIYSKWLQCYWWLIKWRD